MNSKKWKKFKYAGWAVWLIDGRRGKSHFATERERNGVRERERERERREREERERGERDRKSERKNQNKKKIKQSICWISRDKLNLKILKMQKSKKPKLKFQNQDLIF